jgi:hypothetical protein
MLMTQGGQRNDKGLLNEAWEGKASYKALRKLLYGGAAKFNVKFCHPIGLHFLSD